MRSVRSAGATATIQAHTVIGRLGYHISGTLLHRPSVSSRSKTLSGSVLYGQSHKRYSCPAFSHLPVRVQETQTRPRRVVVGITGATGAVYAIHILSILRQLRVESHLVISKWALATLKHETMLSEAEIRGMATKTYTAKDLSASIASGSFQHDGMLIVPCSMKTLAAVRSGFCDDLISRAADVSLKEQRRLVLAIRETPLSDIHLDNMLFLRRSGAVIFPPVPAFYTRPKTIDDLINQTAGRMLDSLGIFTDGFPRWEGFKANSAHVRTKHDNATEEAQRQGG